MDLRLRQLRIIVAVADTRSFTRAGEQLRVSQQSVSALVRDLELRIGTPLFVRTTRSVEPTPACEDLVAGIRPALSILDDALDKAARGNRERPLLIAITPSLAFGELAVLLESLEGYTRIEPEFRETWGDDVGPGLADGRFDAAICLETPSLAGLEIVPWRRHRVDLLVSATHPFAARDEVGVRDLDGCVLIIPGQSGNPGLCQRIADSMLSAGARVVIRDAPRVAGPAPIAVERGDAVTIWLTGMQDRYLPEGLVRVPLRDHETWVVSKLVFLARVGMANTAALEVLRNALSRTSNL